MFFWDSGINYTWHFWLSKGASILTLGPLLISLLDSRQLGFNSSHGSHRMNAFSNRKYFQYYPFPLESGRKIIFSCLIRSLKCIVYSSVDINTKKQSTNKEPMSKSDAKLKHIKLNILNYKSGSQWNWIFSISQEPKHSLASTLCQWTENVLFYRLVGIMPCALRYLFH